MVNVGVRTIQWYTNRNGMALAQSSKQVPKTLPKSHWWENMQASRHSCGCGSSKDRDANGATAGYTVPLIELNRWASEWVTVCALLGMVGVGGWCFDLGWLMLLCLIHRHFPFTPSCLRKATFFTHQRFHYQSKQFLI